MSEDERLVVRMMTYQCELCNKKRRMYIEDGLEELGPDHELHKPVPFIVKCPDCGGYMRHMDPEEDRFFAEGRDLMPWMDRFENRDDRECGYPVFGSIGFDDWKLPFDVKEGLEERYRSYELANSRRPYCWGITDYMIRWARLMEEKIESGVAPKTVIEQHAKELGLVADTKDITGFMYGCAVSALSFFWKHGELLRAWHNAECGIIEGNL